ncbi:MAG: FAD:protein FMN transferase [Gammaproteobacteria bacterium]|nr:FAD:protein FMN transferase [Gammaproteobacteria bacterium]
MTAVTQPIFTIKQKGSFYVCSFVAMNCPCELMIETDDYAVAKSLSKKSVEEALRIEKKFSRYREDNIVAEINASTGLKIAVDEETSHLIHFADMAWQQSEGLFDISSGVLRKVWNFKEKKFPAKKEIEDLKKYVGWEKVTWKPPFVTVPKQMQIDFGGIGKEYATDKIAQLFQLENIPTLVNLGGDIVCTAPPKSQKSWSIGLDDPLHTGEKCIKTLSMQQGAMATSGDARNYLLHEGKRYGHIINPKTAYPVENAPRSVTVCADTCIEAGLFSTLAILHGEAAQAFLEELELPFWLVP